MKNFSELLLKIFGARPRDLFAAITLIANAFAWYFIMYNILTRIVYALLLLF